MGDDEKKREEEEQQGGKGRRTQSSGGRTALVTLSLASALKIASGRIACNKKRKKNECNQKHNSTVLNTECE